MTVRNEAHRIAETLKLALPLVDEAIIVDQSSTDDTAAICRDMGATVLTDKHHGYCEPSRQMAIDATRSQWILLLDADEHCSDRFVSEMRTLDRFPQNRLRIGLKILGETYIVGRSVFRLFTKAGFFHTPKIHSCPMPTTVLTPSMGLYLLPYIAIWDNKSWTELLEGFEGYERMGRTDGIDFLYLARSLSLSGPELDRMSQADRHALGFHPKQEDLDLIKRLRLE